MDDRALFASLKEIYEKGEITAQHFYDTLFRYDGQFQATREESEWLYSHKIMFADAEIKRDQSDESEQNSRK